MIGVYLLVPLILASTLDPDVCGCDFREDIKDYLKKRESWKAYWNAIKDRKDILTERYSAWSAYRRSLDNYSTAVTKDLRGYSEKITNAYAEQIQRISGAIIPPIAVDAPKIEQIQTEVTEVRTSTKFERIESNIYVFFSRLMDIQDYSFRRYTSETTVVSWEVEYQAIHEMQESYKSIYRESTTRMEIGKMEAIRKVADKMLSCAKSGHSDFQSLATINDEIARFRNTYGYSQINQVSSQCAGDWLMRLDATLKHTMTSQTPLSPYSRQVQEQYAQLRQTSSQFQSVVSWTMMRSEELISAAEVSSKVDMESVKTIIKATMKMSNKIDQNTTDWLQKVETSLNEKSTWTSETRDFWTTATLDQIRNRRSPQPQSESPPEPKSPPSSINIPRYPYYPPAYKPSPPNGPLNGSFKPMDGQPSPCPDCDANRDVIDIMLPGKNK